jgi:hypothetical protein
VIATKIQELIPLVSPLTPTSKGERHACVYATKVYALPYSLRRAREGSFLEVLQWAYNTDISDSNFRSEAEHIHCLIDHYSSFNYNNMLHTS